MMRALARVAAACAAALVTLPGVVQAQSAESPVRGLFHYVHSTADAERGFAFYRDVLGIELTRSPFAGPPRADAPPPQIQPAANAGSDQLVWDLTDTQGSRFRNVFMHAPNTPFGLEFSEFFDIARGDRRANAWDPGAAVQTFAVRDLDAAFAAARAAGAPVVTLGGAPLQTPAGRAVLVRDPDGVLVQLVQASPAAIAAAAPGRIVGTSIALSVASTQKALAFWRDLLKLDVQASRRGSQDELRVLGLNGGALMETVATIPGTSIAFTLIEIAPPKGAAPAVPYKWKLQDVGSPQFQLEVRGLDALIARTQSAGYRFLSKGAKPIQRAFGRFVFAIGPDGELVEYVEPAASGAATAAAPPPRVGLAADGTVSVPALQVPVTPYLTPAGRAYLVEHLSDMQTPAKLVQDDGVPRFMTGYLARQRDLYPHTRTDTKLGGVHVYDYTAKSGISAANRKRVLINLHGGGFSGCWPGCAELESIPIASLAQIRVVSVDYREGPQFRHPAASEDVAAVYRELLKTYRAENIGIYGCSAGGMLTAMSVAWFEKHGLPRPGAIGIFCAGAGTPRGISLFEGDAAYTAGALGELRVPQPGAPPPPAGYFEGTDAGDPLVAPINSPQVLAKFPPTLVITATRGFELSGAVYTHAQLVKNGVDARLHVWEGLFHGFFYNPDVPESQDCYRVIVDFFARTLGKRT
jgi:epsilon-lactone hydrolase